MAHGRVILDIGFGDVNTLLPALDLSLDGQVDTWFLDGLAPAKNPDMWRDTLFAAMARLARPESSFATFTAAGFVRRGLQQAVFSVAKVKGFGRKREMLTGTRAPRVIVKGRFIRCSTIDMTRWPNFMPPPFLMRCYQQLAAQGVAFEHQWCGVTQLAWDAKSAGKITHILAAGWPSTLVRPVTREDMAALVGVDTGRDGLTYPAGGWLNPAQLTAGVLRLAAQQGLQTHYRRRLTTLSADDGNGWRLTFACGDDVRHATVVLANGHEMNGLAPTAALPLYAVRGQVSHLPAMAPLAALRQVLCFGGYLTPQSPGFASHCLGASYQRGDTGTDYRDSEQQHNLQRLRACLPDAPWLDAVDISVRQARCGVRSAARDHLPLVGNVPDFEATLRAYGNSPLPDGAALPVAPGYANLFMLGGLGSRGLCSAPLAAEVVAAQIFGEPLPVNRAVAQALNPNRFWVHKLLKGKKIVKSRRYHPVEGI